MASGFRDVSTVEIQTCLVLPRPTYQPKLNITIANASVAFLWRLGPTSNASSITTEAAPPFAIFKGWEFPTLPL
jgi:hypothetical protein